MGRIGSHPDDPRALVAEAYRIEGLSTEDARSIFFDWALGLPEGSDAGAAAARLIAHHAGPVDHPMTALLRETADRPPTTARRRGRHRRDS
ncbi:MAG: hypothetical protein AAGC57_15395 [Pseudomonadota bacterium]